MFFFIEIKATQQKVCSDKKYYSRIIIILHLYDIKLDIILLIYY